MSSATWKRGIWNSQEELQELKCISRLGNILPKEWGRLAWPALGSLHFCAAVPYSRDSQRVEISWAQELFFPHFSSHQCSSRGSLWVGEHCQPSIHGKGATKTLKGKIARLYSKSMSGNTIKHWQLSCVQAYLFIYSFIYFKCTLSVVWVAKIKAKVSRGLHRYRKWFSVVQCYNQCHCSDSFSKGFSHQLWMNFGFPPNACKPVGYTSLTDDVPWLFSLTGSYFSFFTKTCVGFFPLFVHCPGGDTSVTDGLGFSQVPLGAIWD